MGNNFAEKFSPTELARILRPQEAAKLLGVSRITLWRYAKAGFIAPPIKVGPRATGWRLGDLLAAQEASQGSAGGGAK